MTNDFPLAGHVDRALFLKALALVVSDVWSIAEGAAALRIEPSQITAALASEDVQAAVDAEILRLRFSGRLADLKLIVATERFADRLLAIDTSEMNPATAAKIAESIVKTRQSIPQRPTEEEERAKQKEINDRMAVLFMGIRRSSGASHDLC